MSDASSLLPNRVGLTSDCKFDLKPSGVRARNYRASLLPTNKNVFGPADICVIYVPGGRRNTYLDTTQTYIRYTIKNTDTTTATSGQNNDFYLDNTGACVINRLDIYHASNLLETVQQYNVLYNYLCDTSITMAQKLGLSSAYGTSSTIGSLVAASAGSTSTDISRVGQLIKGVDYTTSSTAINQQLTVCMPILSGVIGLGSEKMLPIGKLLDDVRLEIQFESLINAIVQTNASNTSNFQITDVQLECSITELSDEGEEMVNSMLSPEHPIYLHHNSWRHYVSTLVSGSSGGYSTLVPARFGSLKSLVCCPRPAIYQVFNAYSLSARANPNFAQYWWRIGSNLMPPKYVVLENSTTTGGYAEAWMEMQKCFHSVSSAQNSSVLPLSIYNVCDTSASAPSYTPISAINTTTASFKAASGTPGLTYGYGFVIAQEMESFALRNDVLLSGYNTLSQQVFFEAQINNATSSGNYTLDFYANYDGVIVLENGIMSVRF